MVASKSKTMNRHNWIGFVALLLCAQSPAASQKLISFDVTSVKLNKTSDQPNFNFPLGPGDVYTSVFAYKLMGDQVQSVLSQLPGWATTDRFDIVANTDGDPAKDTKDQMRLMMRSLLADRFKLATHEM
jgi:uncharacterized protein (TIGR03435 family)